MTGYISELSPYHYTFPFTAEHIASWALFRLKDSEKNQFQRNGKI